ncbi:hypothetical protein BJ508DRAFT_330665 [Ascobolus immersus RN42]|uniref:Extracellular membrane protein CFEM domain-containing protein n=1 Tax=Ascobolus immersus RN42 TaxID=1160509 RepID=A0A3N4HUY8_ASCIM|nr:hypothetical protein BJ508DRAFT_330665 [Ascobolus immersus RN42]
MKFIHAITLLALPAFVLGAENDTASDKDNIPDFTKLTDLDSLISTLPTCEQGCTKESFLKIFNTKPLLPANCTAITGAKGEAIDWKCPCQALGRSLSVPDPKIFDTDEKLSELGKVLEDISKEVEACAQKVEQQPECKDKETESEEHTMKFKEFCEGLLGVKFVAPEDDEETDDADGKANTDGGSKSDNKKDNKNTDSANKTSGSGVVGVNGLASIAVVGFVALLSVLA